MHDGVPYDPIQGQGQGHDCLKATQEDRVNRQSRTGLIMVALWNRADHYILILWFLLSSFFLSSFLFLASTQRSEIGCLVYHTSTHGVALVRI